MVRDTAISASVGEGQSEQSSLGTLAFSARPGAFFPFALASPFLWLLVCSFLRFYSFLCFLCFLPRSSLLLFLHPSLLCSYLYSNNFALRLSRQRWKRESLAVGHGKLTSFGSLASVVAVGRGSSW